MRLVLSFAAAALVAASSSLAFGQAPPDVAGAETLFERGRALMAAGNLDEACPKFAESQRLAPAAGTALNLATCYDKQGKTASAWGMYREAISLSVASGQALREQYARDRAAELEPKLIKLVVTVGSDDPGLEVRRDGEVMTRAQWGTPIPINPGSHTLEARAPKKKPWTKTFAASAEGTTSRVAVPQLDDAPADPSPVAAVPSSDASRSGGGALRVVGFATMAVGVALAGAGGYFALDASSKEDDLEQDARNREAWNADRQAMFDGGESSATMANVFFVSGGVALATGAVLTILGYMKKSEASAAARLSAPAFAGGGITSRGGSLRWTF